MNKKHFNFKIVDDHIIVYYKSKELFKVSNNINNARNMLKLLED